MGQKNARGRVASLKAVDILAATKKSTKTTKVPALAVPMNTMPTNTLVSPATPSLGFRSLINGTLDQNGNPIKPKASTPPNGTSESTTKQPESLGVANIRTLIQNMPPLTQGTDSTPTPQGSNTAALTEHILPQTKGTFTTRQDKAYKNIVIGSTFVWKNVTRLANKRIPSTRVYRPVETDEFTPEEYDIFKDLANMKEDEKKRFWETKFVEIFLDFSDNEINTKGQGQHVVHMIEKLGPELPIYAKNIFIKLVFPKPTCSESKASLPSGLKILDIPSVKQVIALANKMHEFKGMVNLSVTLLTLNKEGEILNTPLKTLMHAIPFFDLDFTAWRLFRQSGEWNQNVLVRGEPIHLLNLQYSKIKKQRQDVLDNAIIVRYSAFKPVSK